MKLAAIPLIVLGSFILGVSPVAGDQAPIDIGTQKQLFIDDTVIDTSERIAKTQHQFIPHPDNPLVVRQEPWERAEFVYGTVIRDPDTHQFRMWCTNAGIVTLWDNVWYTDNKPLTLGAVIGRWFILS